MLTKTIVPGTLLPIREAYEWKPEARKLLPIQQSHLLPIREAYEWKLFECLNFELLNRHFLLPIREAYEWKQPLMAPTGPLDA